MASWTEATNAALAAVRHQVLTAAAAANQQVVEAGHPSSVVRSIDGVDGAPDVAFALTSRIVFRYRYMEDVVRFALQTLRDLSPVGSVADEHPGLYRDNHLVFIDGRLVPDVSAWRPGQQINISNPEPYARKIESGHMTLSVPNHIYEDAALLVASRYGESVAVKFVYMPVVVGTGRPGWTSRQPALQINQR